MDTTTEANSDSLQLKADFVPLTVLKLQDCQLDNIKVELEKTTSTAPGFFDNTPIIIDIGGINEQLKPFLDLAALCTLLRSFSINPIGIRGLSQKQHQMAKDHGLAVLNQRAAVDTTATKENKKPDTPKKREKRSNTSAKDTSTAKLKTKIIEKPVRAGSQVYAKNSDLLILAPVNAGAEVIADGNIHIHGPLRGKALAGASGNKHAKIFCQTLEAELIAISGNYLVSDEFDKIKKPKSMVHISLGDNDKLTIQQT